MNGTVKKILLNQQILLNHAEEPMRNSLYVFPNSNGEIRRRDSYQKHFTKIRKLAGIPDSYRPNYCLRDTIASFMLSEGATLDEVGYQLGH